MYNHRVFASDRAMHLDDRAKRVLHALVVRYLQDGQPVGSRTLAGMPAIDCSAATVRNVMSDLEDIGFLVSPHTSAGRVPSSHGIRFFVDRLLTVSSPTRRMFNQLRAELRGDTVSDVRESAAKVVSQLTHYAGFVVAPGAAKPVVRKLRFVKLSSNRVLAVIITDTGDVLNRVFTHDEMINDADLAAAANVYNEHFSGMAFDAVWALLRTQLSDLRTQIRQLLRGLLQHMDNESETVASDLRLAGEMNLLNEADLFADVTQLRELYDLLARKKELLALIEGAHPAENVCVFIGSECGLKAMRECSIVFSSCVGKDKSLGVIGVIGPKRMPYNRVIPTVNVAAKLLGGLLEELRLSE